MSENPLRDKIIAAQVKNLGLHYQQLGKDAANKKLKARHCPFKHPFKQAHWLKGYYIMIKEKGEND